MKYFITILFSAFILGSYAQDGFPSGLVYSLDIGTVNTKVLKSKKLTDIGTVYLKELGPDNFQYKIGAFKTYAEAEAAKKQLEEMNYTPTIRAFYNKEPLNVLDAAQLESTIKKIEQKLEETISVEELNLLIEVMSE